MTESYTDWRLAGQEKYLQGIQLKFVGFRKRAGREDWDHEHCEFCSQKIVERADMVKYDAEVICEAYCNEFEDRWICPTCFRDFQARFDWKLNEIRCMKSRRKCIIVTSCLVICSFAVLWFLWSPLANVDGKFTLGDQLGIRLAVRTQTLKSILSIYECPDGTVRVYTGFQRGPLYGGGVVYKLKKTKKGWHIRKESNWIS